MAIYERMILMEELVTIETLEETFSYLKEHSAFQIMKPEFDDLSVYFEYEVDHEDKRFKEHHTFNITIRPYDGKLYWHYKITSIAKSITLKILEVLPTEYQELYNEVEEKIEKLYRLQRLFK
jgi:hypothetical protein